MYNDKYRHTRDRLFGLALVREQPYNLKGGGGGGVRFAKIFQWNYHIHVYHPSLPLYLPADSISKTRIKVRVS
jgi:hypothetical protein